MNENTNSSVKAEQLIQKISTRHYQDTTVLAKDFAKLVELAESREHLRFILQEVCPRDSYGKDLAWGLIWDKWVRLAIIVSDLQFVWGHCRYMSVERQNAILRKWYSLATTFDEMLTIPKSPDDHIFNQLIVVKRRRIIHEALQNATTCRGIISILVKVEYEDMLGGTLLCYDAWRNDQDVGLEELKHLEARSGVNFRDFQGDISAKWLIVSKRKISEAQTTQEITSFPRSAIHPEAEMEFTERWDALAVAELALASTVDGVRDVVNYCRPGSEVSRLARAKFDQLYCDLLEKQGLTQEDLENLSWNTECCPVAARIATEQLVGMVTTEEEMRKLWPRASKFPQLKEQLADKLIPLIR